MALNISKLHRKFFLQEKEVHVRRWVHKFLTFYLYSKNHLNSVNPHGSQKYKNIQRKARILLSVRNRREHEE